jgi:hypothetical protein
MQRPKGVFGKQDFRYVTEEFTFVPPARGSPIITPRKKTDWLYADTGPMPVKAAPSKPNARLAKSDGSRDGSRSIFSKPFNVGLMNIPRRCASGVDFVRDRFDQGFEEVRGDPAIGLLM